MNSNFPLRVIEVLVLGGIVSAFLLPLVFSGEPEATSSQSTLTIVTRQASVI